MTCARVTVSPKLLLCGGDMAPWGQGTLSQVPGVAGGTRFGELALLHVCEWRLIFLPRRKWNDSVAEVEWNKSSQVGHEQTI